MNHINEILQSSTKISITENSSIITNLNEYVYPFYIDYIELFVKEMYNLMANYLKTYQYQSKMLEILQILNKKSNEIK